MQQLTLVFLVLVIAFLLSKLGDANTAAFVQYESYLADRMLLDQIAQAKKTTIEVQQRENNVN